MEAAATSDARRQQLQLAHEAPPSLWGAAPPPPQWFVAASLTPPDYGAPVWRPSAPATPPTNEGSEAPSPPPAPKPARKKPALRLRNFLCMHPGCGKSFTDNAHLRDHTFVHTGERSLRCEQCGRSFARPSTLHDHQRVHSGERPYCCAHTGCDKRYSSRTALRFHVAAHATRNNSSSSAASADAPALLPTAVGDSGADTRALHAQIQAQQAQITALQAELERLRRKPNKQPTKPTKAAAVAPPPPMVAPVAFLLDGVKPFECRVCAQRFANFFQLSFHAKQHAGATLADVAQGQQPLPVGPKFCPEPGCEYERAAGGGGRALKNLQTLKRHWQRRHQTARPFACTRCVASSSSGAGASGASETAPKTFKTRENLKAHEKDCRGNAGAGDSQRERGGSAPTAAATGS